MYKKILVPLDGSPLAEEALPHAQALAKTEGAEIILLRVPITPAAQFVARDPTLANLIIKDMEEESNKYLDDEVSKLENEGAKVIGISRDGPIPETILDVAKETHADMIVMSTHGRTGVKRWLMGSVADRVVHYASIPVMLIHSNLN